MAFCVVAEPYGALGRSDLEIDAPKVRWLLELKYQCKGESVEALLAKATEPVTEKQYGLASTKPVICVAAVFSEEKRHFQPSSLLLARQQRRAKVGGNVANVLPISLDKSLAKRRLETLPSVVLGI